METEDLTFRLYFDGACLPRNPGGHMGAGFYIMDADEFMVASGSRYIEAHDDNSNNVAEYMALVDGLKAFRAELEHCKYTKKVNLYIFGDSMLVVKQMNNQWRINEGLYTMHALEAWDLLEELDPYIDNLGVYWIPREQNTKADEFSIQELTKKGIHRDSRFKHLQR